MNILIVDDIAENRKLLRAQLEAEGFSVVEAVDGVNALEVLAAETPLAIISDIQMPRMDGYRLCYEVRKQAPLRNLNFILYSSTYTAPGDVRFSDTVGADQFIRKPAPAAVILAALQIPTQDRVAGRPEKPSDEIILAQYNSVLVAKLEQRNTELLLSLDASRLAHRKIRELNAALEEKAHERLAANAELVARLEGVLRWARLNEHKLLNVKSPSGAGSSEGSS